MVKNEVIVEQAPVMGSIVIYTSLGIEDQEREFEQFHQQPAIVTRIRENSKLCLTIFYPHGQYMKDDIPYSKAYERGHWSWPAKTVCPQG